MRRDYNIQIHCCKKVHCLNRFSTPIGFFLRLSGSKKYSIGLPAGRQGFDSGMEASPCFHSGTGGGQGTGVSRGVRMHGYAFARPEADVPRRGRGLFQQKKDL